MQITVKSTPIIVQLGEPGEGRARRWEGTNESGIPCGALIAAIYPLTHDFAVAARFAAELEEIDEIKFEPPPEPDPPGAVDRRRTEALGAAIMGSVLSELARGPPTPENVFVVLNALAATAATVIVGTDEQRGREFFDQAMAQNIADLRPGSSAPTTEDDAATAGGWKATLFSGDRRPVFGSIRTTQRLHWTREEARAEAHQWLAEMRLEPITSWDPVDDRWEIGRNPTHYVIVRRILLPLGPPPRSNGEAR